MSKLTDKLLENKKYKSDQFHRDSSIEGYSEESKEVVFSEEWTKINFKSYPRLDEISLPEPDELKGELNIIGKRRSVRKFKKGETIAKPTLSSLLNHSVGFSDVESNIENDLRVYPSAGARFPIETYVIADHVEGLKRGLYHFNLRRNSLEVLLKEDLENFLVENTGQDFVRDAALTFVLTGVLDRTRVKYGERGYRFVLMEAGHVCQNLYLVSKSLKLKGCAIGGFVDNSLNELLDLEIQSEKVLYLFTVGR